MLSWNFFFISLNCNVRYCCIRHTTHPELTYVSPLSLALVGPYSNKCPPLLWFCISDIRALPSIPHPCIGYILLYAYPDMSIVFHPTLCCSKLFLNNITKWVWEGKKNFPSKFIICMCVSMVMYFFFRKKISVCVCLGVGGGIWVSFVSVRGWMVLNLIAKKKCAFVF